MTADAPGDDAGAALRMDPAALTLWRLRVVGGAAAAGLVVAGFAATGPPGWQPALAGTVVLLAAAAGWSWASRRFARLRLRITDEVLELSDGVVLHTEATVPLFRVQHIDLGQGPVERVLDLATLVVHTAAPAADVVVPGVAASAAATARDDILAASREAAARHGIEDLDAV